MWKQLKEKVLCRKVQSRYKKFTFHIIIGKILSIFAMIIFSSQWRKLKQRLQNLYIDYCKSLKSTIPKVLIWALVCGEDHRFFTHRGIDIIAILRAFWNVSRHYRLEGGSTIEQQLVRTITKDYRYTLSRKVKEMLLATLVQNVIPNKEDIAGVYLSIAYFGWRMNGILQTCQRFRFTLHFLTEEEASFIIACLKYPQPKRISSLRLHQTIVRSKHILEIMRSKRVSPIFNMTKRIMKKGGDENESFPNF